MRLVPEWTFGDHRLTARSRSRTRACEASRGKSVWALIVARQPKGLEVKLSVMDTEPTMVDHLILLRPEDDLTVAGKSKALWQEAERHSKHTGWTGCLSTASLDLYAFRTGSRIHRQSPQRRVPNLADVIRKSATNCSASVHAGARIAVGRGPSELGSGQRPLPFIFCV